MLTLIYIYTEYLFIQLHILGGSINHYYVMAISDLEWQNIFHKICCRSLL